MIPIMDFQERSVTGPVMKAMDFDIAFSKALRELVAKYEIKYDSNELIIDDATADAIFNAGVELLARIGLYHLETQRVIQFDEAEVRQVAKEYRENPPEPVFGTGKEQIRIKARRCDDPTPPILAGGAAGTIEPEWFVPFVQSFIEEPMNKALGIAGGITSVGNHVPKGGTLSEMHCAQWECRELLELLNRAGRPGMHLGLLCTASSIGAIMACMRPGLRDASNTQIGVHIIPEQKIDWTRLMLAKFCEDEGITPWTSSVSIMGALCRDAADTAVGMIANLLGQLCYGHGSLSNLFTNHMDGSWADAEAIWAVSGACRASERNIRVPIAGVCAGTLGFEGTRVGMLQTAATTVANTASGFSYAWIAGGSGLEARLVGEIMNGTAGMGREDAGALVRKILEVAENEKSEGQIEKKFDERYDIKGGVPKPEFVDDDNRVREILSDLSVPMG